MIGSIPVSRTSITAAQSRYLDSLRKTSRRFQDNQFAPAHTEHVRAAEAVELVALEVFRQAENSGQLVSMSMINRALDQLGSHRPSCRCGLCGETAVKAKPAEPQIAQLFNAMAS